MNYYSQIGLQSSSQELNQPGPAGELLFEEQGELSSIIGRAMRPFMVKVSGSKNGATVSGCEVAVLLFGKILARLNNEIAENGVSDWRFLKAIIDLAIADALKRDLEVRRKGLPRAIQPKSLGQVSFLQTLFARNDILIFGIGATGTGKTYTAIAAALDHLAVDRVNRVIITRPHIIMEGEIVAPDIRGELAYDDQFEYLEDILIDLVGYQKFRQLVDDRRLELLPLGQLRGRTFNHSFVVLDEAQNMTVRKMRMALTRIGRDSRMVITGDPTAIDLPDTETSGLSHVLELLQGSDIARVHRFDKSQIIRNRVVARLEQLYDSATEALVAAAE